MMVPFCLSWIFLVSFIGVARSLLCQPRHMLKFAAVRSGVPMLPLRPFAVVNVPRLSQIRVASDGTNNPGEDIVSKLNAEADQFAVAGGLLEVDDVEPLEKAVRDTMWSGQGTMEEVTQSKNNWGDLLARKGLVAADAIALLAFAALGRSSHNEGFNIIADVVTAAPFLASWLLLSPFLGTYARSATASYQSAASRLLPGWVVCIPVALAVRGLLRGAMPPVPFVVVSLVATYLALLLGRCVYILLAGSTSEEERRSAGLLELLPMVSTLMRRW